MPRILPNLWYAERAEEAVAFYVSLFPGSRIVGTTRYGKEGFEIHGQPEGRVMTLEFELAGQGFVALNGGPVFRFNPSISFLVACSSKDEVDAFWDRLAEGGSPLMELGEYPFSPRYGWTEDRYGVSWQVMDMSGRGAKRLITPTLMFVGDGTGLAEKAIGQYIGIFPDSSVGEIMRYVKGEEPDGEGTVKHASFTLSGQAFAAMDSAYPHGFTFKEAVSLIVECADQADVDQYWNHLGDGGDPLAQQCGWLKDRYGVSWQVVPTALMEMLRHSDREKVGRVMAALLAMKKLDLAALTRAFEGR